MSTSSLRDAVRDELVEFAWSQWAQLGLSAHRTRSDQWALDPEALVLFTLEVARREPRLFDESLDWLCRNGRFLSLQRVRNLARRFPVERSLLDAVVAWVGEAAPAVRWPKAGHRADHCRAKSPAAVSFVGEQDQVFSQYGYVRSTVAPSGKSTVPDIHLPVNLPLRLRLFFGPGTRSEVMRILLTCNEGSLDAARIADEAGYAKRNVNEALTALAHSGAAKVRWAWCSRRRAARCRWCSAVAWLRTGERRR